MEGEKRRKENVEMLYAEHNHNNDNVYMYIVYVVDYKLYMCMYIHV